MKIKQFKESLAFINHPFKVESRKTGLAINIRTYDSEKCNLENTIW